MRIVNSFQSQKPIFSFEFFPPKDPQEVDTLIGTVRELSTLQPSFVSVTYGAGGHTRHLTVELVSRIKNEIGVEAMAHLTCVGHTSGEIAEILDRLESAGIENVLALRGDPPRGQREFVRTEGGFGYADELVHFIRSRYDFCVGGAGYPEGHVESTDLEADLRNLKAKVEAGLDFVITQLFFEAGVYFKFVERARAAGINAPILPGIMPVTNVKSLERFTSMCGASIPESLRERLQSIRDDTQAVQDVGVEWATELARNLLAGGAPGIHFYTLNKSRSTVRVFQNL
jgi:methylenetetrahydrofolate reductase (NADPH)